jgi:lipid-A-disaccharide synthase-like uncharacterized protein
LAKSQIESIAESLTSFARIAQQRESPPRPAGKKAVHSPTSAQPFLAMNAPDLTAATNFFHITLTPWKFVGLAGSLIFGLRFLIQWIASERAKKSVIPVGFWECSAIGSLLTLSYFAIYRHDSVGILQTALPLPIYLRNLYFRWTHHHAQHPGNEPRQPQ